MIIVNKQDSDDFVRHILHGIDLPVACWSLSGELLYASKSILSIFDCATVEEFCQRVDSFSPERQPCGTNSVVGRKAHLRRAALKGEHNFLWTHVLPYAGETLVEYTLKRIEYKNEPVIVVHMAQSKDLLSTLKEKYTAEKRAKAMVDASPMGITFWNKNFSVIDCNEVMLQLVKAPSKEYFIENSSAFDASLPTKTSLEGISAALICREAIKSAFKKGFFQLQWTHQAYDGELVPVHITLKRIQFADEDVVLGYTQDLRELKASQKAAAEATEYIQIMLDTISLGANIWNKDFENVASNRAAAELFDLNSPEEYLRRFPDLSPEFQPDGQPSMQKAVAYIQEAFDKGECKFEWLHQKLNGEPVPCEITLIRKEFRGEEIVVGYTKDMRELKASQQAAAEAAEYLQIMQDTISLGANIWNKDFQNFASNRAAAELFDLDSPEEYLRRFPDLSPEFQPDGQPSMQKALNCIKEAFDKGKCQFEWMHQKLNGEPIPCEITLIRKEFRGEEIVVGYTKDIRELKASQKVAEEATEYRQIMLDTMSLGTNIWNKNFENIASNRAAAELFGLKSSEEYLYLFPNLSPKFQPDGQPSMDKAKAHVQEAFDNGQCIFEWMHQKLDGEPVPCEITLIRKEFRGEEIVVGYTKDIRELKASQKVASDATELRRVILNTMPIAVTFWNKEYELFDCNAESVSLFNARNKEEVLQKYAELSPEFQPDGIPSEGKVEIVVRTAFEKGHIRFEWMHQDVYGNELPVEVTLIRSRFRGEDIAVAYLRDLREFKKMLHEIETVQKDLRKAKDAAEQSTKAKSEFLANMSHEIRTPMNGILGLLHLLSATNVQSDQKSYVDKALYSANNLLRIINDILDFSKIEAGKLEIEATPFTLAQIFKEVHDLYGPPIEEKGLDFLLSKVDVGVEYVLGDSLRLKQILFNLVSNAIKFTKTGHIKLAVKPISCTEKSIECLFSVEDTGIGLDEGQIQNLFTAFSQADTSITRKYGGTGLGLAISRSLAHMMQGELWVESAIGQGATFYFTATFDLCSNSIDIKKEKDMSKALMQGSGYLLLVEDNEINQLIAEELLRSMGYTLDIANNGQEALDMVQKNSYDLVLMDIQMPIMDGLTASKKIREQAQFDEMPIVAMSAHAMTGDKEISLAHGMNDHLTKPIVPEILHSTVQYWLNKVIRNMGPSTR